MMDNKNTNFFTRLLARKNNKETVVEEITEEPVDESKIPTTGTVLPQTLIQFTPEQEERFSAAEKERLQKILLELPPLRIGEINFVPFEAGNIYGGYFVKVFIRNGRELLEEFTLETLPLVLIDAAGDRAAAGVFKPANFGTLKFGESRVWTFAFRPEQVTKKDADLSSFTVAFQ